MFPVSHPLECTCVACKEQDRLDKLRAECAHEFGPWQSSFIGRERMCSKCKQRQAQSGQRQGDPHG